MAAGRGTASASRRTGWIIALLPLAVFGVSLGAAGPIIRGVPVALAWPWVPTLGIAVGLPEPRRGQGRRAPTINYGVFLNAVVNFVLVGFAVFLVVRAVNRRLAPAPAPAAPPTRDCFRCTRAIPLRASKCPECTAELSAT